MTIKDFKEVVAGNAKITIYENVMCLRVAQKLEEIPKEADNFKINRIMALRPEHYYLEVEEA